MEKHRQHTIAELLVQDTYQPEDVAEMLDMDVDRVRTAIFAGELRAEVVGHTIISIRREDMLDWMNTIRA